MVKPTDNETSQSKNRIKGGSNGESLDVEAKHGKGFWIGLHARGPRAVDAARWLSVSLILGGLVFVAVLILQWALK